MSRGSKGFLDNRSKTMENHVQPFDVGGEYKSPPRLCGFKCFGLCVCDVLFYVCLCERFYGLEFSIPLSKDI